MSAVSILLSGAELAEFKNSANLQLFWSPGEEEEAEEESIELRSKTGTSAAGFSVVPFQGWSRGEGDPKLRLFGGDSDGLSEPPSPIILKSRAVIQHEKQMKWSRQLENPPNPPKNSHSAADSKKTKKQRAVSMDESSLNQLRSSSGRRISRENLFGSSRRENPFPIKQQPLPLPLPPEELSGGHRRHRSIDLRASPAAKFLVQLMPWEIPGSDQDEPPAARTTSGSRVPFKWEEAPGKPKSEIFSSVNKSTARKLRLPPRLQQQQQSDCFEKAGGTAGGTSVFSPTSTLDQRGVAESSSVSSASSPGGDQAEVKSLKISSQRQEKIGNVPRYKMRFMVCWGDEDEVGKKKKKRSKMRKVKSWSSGTANLYGSTTNYGYGLSLNGSWSPAVVPGMSWLQRSGMEMSRNGAFGKLANGCNVVKRAVRFRWWACRRRAGGDKKQQQQQHQRKSMYKPLLCSVDGG